MTGEFVFAPWSFRIFPVQTKSRLSYRSLPGGIPMEMGLAVAESGHFLCGGILAPLGVDGLYGRVNFRMLHR